MSNIEDIVRAITEGEEEEDFKDLLYSGLLPKGSHVKIKTGAYAGEPAMVVGYFHFGENEWGYWAHLDHSSDPNDVITYRKDDVEMLNEAIEGEEGFDALSEEPNYEFRHKGEPGASYYDVFVGQEWLGRIHPKQVDQPGRFEKKTVWCRSYVPKRLNEPEMPECFDSAKDAARALWRHWWLYHDDPTQYEHHQDPIQSIINEVIEDEEGDDFAFQPDTVATVRSALEHAGFEVKKCEQEGDSLVLVFSWARPTASAYVNGAKRAFELLEPIIGKIKQGDYRAESYLKGVHGDEKWADMTLRKRVEDDPKRWRVEREAEPQGIGINSFYKVFFQGEELGRFYASSEGAERLRRELVELHKVMPFYNKGWRMPGDEGDDWGTGPIIAWWRTHRDELPKELRVGEYHLDKSLTSTRE